MNSQYITDTIEKYIKIHGGHETRYYLGMSQIYRSEQELIDGLRHGSPTPSDEGYRVMALGYDYERIMLSKMEAMRLVKPDSGRKLVADFDSRFQGNTDAEFLDGSLCDVKSTIEAKLQKIEASGKVPHSTWVQMQMYLHFGGYPYGSVVYIARDTGSILVRKVNYMPSVAQEYIEKAKRILSLI